HISHLSNSFVSDPAKIVKLGQKVTVRVLEVDVPRKRISLSMKLDAPPVKRSEKRKAQNPPKSRPRREERTPDGDLQAKLAMLKGKFK
ncbi:MAG: S1 RNA-binding domain-containing protein, partial [Ekhidna sp.]|nr:S1 RNA-binding domain-containing protein [Ekhidna sp.]